MAGTIWVRRLDLFASTSIVYTTAWPCKLAATRMHTVFIAYTINILVCLKMQVTRFRSGSATVIPKFQLNFAHATVLVGKRSQKYADPPPNNYMAELFVFWCNLEFPELFQFQWNSILENSEFQKLKLTENVDDARICLCVVCG